MRKLLMGVLVIVLAVVGVGVGMGRTVAGMYRLSFLAEPAEVTALSEAAYVDANVSVQVAFTEGMYVIGAAALNRDVVVLLQEGDMKQYITTGSADQSPAYSYDELTAERLTNVRVLVYDTAGWTLNRKPMLALRVDSVKTPLTPASVAAFKQSLLPR